MRLYHGSNVLFRTPDLDLCRPDKDFGRGFYLTAEEAQARKMAYRTTIRFGGEESLMAFDFDWHAAVAAELKIRRFDVPNKEWAMFVMANRRPQRESDDPVFVPYDCGTFIPQVCGGKRCPISRSN